MTISVTVVTSGQSFHQCDVTPTAVLSHCLSSNGTRRPSYDCGQGQSITNWTSGVKCAGLGVC